MATKSIILIVFLTVCCFRSLSFSIEPLERVTLKMDTEQKGNKNFQSGTLARRVLQAVYINDDGVSSVTREILLILNGLRRQKGLSQLTINQEDQQIIGIWSRNFRQIYSLKEYLERLGRFAGSGIMEFYGMPTKEKLVKRIQQESVQWVQVARLNQVGILVQIEDNQYNALILTKNLIQATSQIQVKTYVENHSRLNELKSQIKAQHDFQKQHQTKPNQIYPVEAKNPVEKSTLPHASTSSAPESSPAPVSPAMNPKAPSSSQQPTISPRVPSIPTDAIENKRISNTAFSSMILYHDLPSTFLNTEQFMLKGRLLQAPLTDDGVTIMIFFNHQNTNQFTRFMGWVPKGQTEFQLPLLINKLKQGKYFLSAQVNRTFSTAGIYTVKSNTLALRTQRQNAPLPPSNLSVALKGNKLYCTWNPDDRNALIRITFDQRLNKRREYVLSNFPSQFQVPYRDFYDFVSGPVSVSISSAYSSSPSEVGQISEYSAATTVTFNAIEHHFDQTRDRQIQISVEIPFKIKVGDSIVISGKALNQLGNKIYVLEPSKTFAEYFFNGQNRSEILSVGRTFSKQLNFLQEGIYIIEVNNVAGSAVINQPVYVGQGLPLLPDYQDLREQPRPNKDVANDQPTTLAEKSKLMLKLINQKRTEFGVKPIVGDSELDRLAQLHSDDMVARNFFGHINPSKETPQDRATRIGIRQGVSENIAKNNNVTDGHYSLCRSNAHLMNIVNKDWEKVGLGFTWDQNYFLLITQQFAGRDYFKNPLSEAEINAYKSEMISIIKQLNPTVRSENIGLSEGLSEWQTLPAQSQNSQSIMSFLRLKGLRNFSIGNIRLYFQENFVENMKVSGYLQSNKPIPTEVGIGMKMDDGWLEIFIAYI